MNKEHAPSVGARFISLCLICFALGIGNRLFAQADFVVDQSGSTGYTTIQSALNAVTQDNQVIEVHPGIYQEVIYVQNYSVTLRSTGGAGSTIIDSGQQDSGISVFTDSTIDGFTLKNGYYNGAGGGVWVNSNNVTLINCVVRDNACANSGSALYAYYGNLTAINCTLFNNRGDDGSNAIRTENGTITLLNTIAWDGDNEIGLDVVTGLSSVSASYSDVRGTSTYSGQGNINSDPKLCADGHLMSNSPCIDAGTTTGAPNTDMDNESRPVGSGNDIGADEYLDTDGHGLPDWWQNKYFGQLGNLPSTTDSNGLTSLQSYQYQFDPTASTLVDAWGNTTDYNGISYAWEMQYFGTVQIDPNADPDGDGYSNIIEYLRGTDPTLASSIPSPDFVVDQSGNTGYSTIQSALDAVTQDNQIIEVNPGIYQENLNFQNHKIIIRSSQGARTTVIDGTHSNTVLSIYANCIIQGFTLKNGYYNGVSGCIYVESSNLKLTNCVICNNSCANAGSVIYAYNGSAVFTNCTLFNNHSEDGSSAIQTQNGTISLINTIAWDGGNEIGVDASTGQSTITAVYCDIQGSSYPGIGNISVDPLLWPDGHLSTGSPCINSGTATGAPIKDMDNEARPAGSGYDIGADEYVDTDGQGLPNWWQLKYFGQLGTSPSTQDPNGLTNLQSYQDQLDPTLTTPTDFSGSTIDSNNISYAWELQYFGAIHIDPYADPDGDGYPNIYEYTHGTSPVDPASKPTADIVVDQSGSGNYTSIQSAIDGSSNDYQIIQVNPGVYQQDWWWDGYTLSRGLRTHDYKVMLISRDGALTTTIDAQQYGFAVKTEADSVIGGFTLINGTSGGISVYICNLKIFNCIVRDNTSSSSGSAIYATADAPPPNTTPEIVALDASTSSSNTTVSNSGNVTVVNCTFYNNKASDGTAAIQTTHGAVKLLNSILWNNGVEIALDSATGATSVTANFCDIDGAGIYTGIGNINADPLLSSDYHILTGSPCIDVATAAGAPNRDMDNEVRPFGSGYDIGADEYVDTNGQGLPDWWQNKYFGHLVDANALSPNGDGLTNLQNYQQKIDPTNPIDSNGIAYTWELQYFGRIHIDPSADPDNDGYSNIVEYLHNSDPTSASSIPTPDIVVDPTGSTGYTTIQSALSAVTQDYQVIVVNPGTYRESGINFPSYKIEVHSSAGAASTIIDSHLFSGGPSISTDAVLDGLSIINGSTDGNGGGINISGGNVKLRNCVIANNLSGSGGSAIYSCSNVTVVNCTLLNNATKDGSATLQTNNGTITLLNTIVWNTGNEVGADYTTGLVAVTASYCDIKGTSTYSGQGNINADPLLRADGHIMSGSPCIDSGTTNGATRCDMDNEARPAGGGYDIGADEYTDTNGNGLPDWWQQKYFGGLNVSLTATSPAGDGLTNYQNYQQQIDPINSNDTNGIPYAWELQYFNTIQIDANADSDGDGFPNGVEYSHNTDPTSSSSVPVADFIVDPSGSTGYATIQSALNAVTRDYQIIAVRPGTYHEYNTTMPNYKVLLRSTDGAAATTIAPGYLGIGLIVNTDAVIDGFTIKTGWGNWSGWSSTIVKLMGGGGGIYIQDGNVKIANCVFSQNSADAGSAVCSMGDKTTLVNCTFFQNYGSATIEVTRGSLAVVNTIAWDGSNEIVYTANVSASVSYSDIQGTSVYPGQGNINADPQLWPNHQSDAYGTYYPDGHIMAGSPCIGAGNPATTVNRDMDNEIRAIPGSVDIGADQYRDSDGGGLPDWWQKRYFGNTGVDPTSLALNGVSLLNCYKWQLDPTTIGTMDSNGISYAWEIQNFNQVHINPNADPDWDGLSNLNEYLYGTDPHNRDTNGDGIWDGISVAAGINPTTSQPSTVDSDGDGVPDAQDAYPNDPTQWLNLTNDPNDHTPPVIELDAPMNATQIQ